MGEETIIEEEDSGYPIISEELCTGCGICVHKCPFDAISIVNLPEELEQPIHQFGVNSFRLFRLPIPRKRSILGLIGANGIGKTTALRILNGEIMPNLGDYESIEKKDLSRYFRGSELQAYFEKLDSGLKTVSKPQNVYKILKVTKGRVSELLERVDERSVLRELTKRLEISEILERDVENLSGGELQRLLIIACCSKDADLYYFDEPSSYLDIRQRLRMAQVIRELSEEKTVVLVEHDLAILDYLSDFVHIFYGKPSVYGIVSQPYGVRAGINTYLSGYIRDENVRFRDSEITFEERGKIWESREILLSYPKLTKRFKGFSLEVESGEIYRGEVLGIVGPNATGKSTFVKLLAGIEKPEEEFQTDLKVSYKPQYLKADFSGDVEEALFQVAGEKLQESHYISEILEPLELLMLFERKVSELSGGELQRLSIALCLSREAELYLLDEPSAYLDVEQRLSMSKVTRRLMERRESTALVVEHDIVSTDYISDRIMVFSGNPSKKGFGSKPFSLREGMNDFLKRFQITFRRDPESGRPRANKKDSKLDREQKRKGEYYYQS